MTPPTGALTPGTGGDPVAPPSGALSTADLAPSAVLFDRFQGLRRTNRSGLVVVALLVLLALLAPVLAPYDPAEQLDPRIGAGRPPLSTLIAVESRASGRTETLLADAVEVDGDELVLDRRGAPLRLRSTEARITGRRTYLLGTDRLGRDVLSRILLGSRVSLGIGVLAAAIAVGLGVAAGALAALGGALLDALVMRFVDGMLALPTLLLVLTVAVLFQPSFLVLVLVIGGVGWMSLSRLVRAEIMTLKQREFFLAGRSIGVPAPTLFAKHLLPNAISPIAVTGSLLVGDAIMVEASLSFLGLGVSGELPSWGRMIANGRDDLRTLWWISTFPGAAIAVTVLAFALLGDGLRDLLDPREAADRRRRALEPASR